MSPKNTPEMTNAPNFVFKMVMLVFRELRGIVLLHKTRSSTLVEFSDR